MSEHACRWKLAPGLDHRGRVAPGHDAGPSDNGDESRLCRGPALTAAPIATPVQAEGHGPPRVLLQLEDADLDVGRDHGGQAVLRYSTLQVVTELLRRGGWAIREHPDIHHIEVHPERLGGTPTIRGRRIPARQVAVLVASGFEGLRALREGYDVHRAEIEDAVRWYDAVTAYDRVA